ncbi:MAG: DUF4956 domain-containing protein [Mogibacterium sp.]|nr:DUF4956 domain-containing protein [Mogibacterium sp.]
MLDNLLGSIYDTQLVTSISMAQFATAMGTALVLGLLIALTYMHNTRYTRSFVVTLALLPAIISVIIIMVNGSVGTGVAVAGAFSLVRFRSVPGTAREICTIFLAMATGLIAGMGFIALAALFTIVMCLIFLLYGKLDLGTKKNADKYKTFKIVIPEDLDYTGVFEDLFDEYTSAAELTGVKTTNMGSMYKLQYDVVLRDPAREKELIDKIRCRNGNLEINVSRQGTVPVEL